MLTRILAITPLSVLAAAGLIMCAAQAAADVNDQRTLIELKTKSYSIKLDSSICLSTVDTGGGAAFESSTSPGPTVNVKTKFGQLSIPLASAGNR